jgi:hypothetical protein
MSLQSLDPQYADDIFTELGSLEVGLDSDPLVYGPKRLNGKIALSRKMTARCERLYLDVSQKLSQYKRAFRQAELDLDLAKKHLLANDPEVRAGRAVSERDAIAYGKLKVEVQALHHATHAVEDLDAVLTVVKAKRSDLRDVQGRLRDQIRLCQEEIGLGGRWGSKSPRGTELEPGQGFADGNDVDDVDALIQNVRAVSDAETHLMAEEDNTDPEAEQEADLVVAEDEDEPEDEGASLTADDLLGEDDEDEDEPEVVEPEPEIIPGDKLVGEFGFVPHCEACGEMQSKTPGGMTCPNGHGGAGSVPLESEELKQDSEEPAAATILPGTSKVEDVADFLSGFDDDENVSQDKGLSRRAVEEANEELDIDSILSNFEG